MYNRAVAASPQEAMTPVAPVSGMIGIGAIILKTPLGLRIIKLRPTGGAFASGKVAASPLVAAVDVALSRSLVFQVRVGDIILEVEGL
jgi:hypothetical protein